MVGGVGSCGNGLSEVVGVFFWMVSGYPGLDFSDSLEIGIGVIVGPVEVDISSTPGLY